MEVKFLSFERIEARLTRSARSWIYHRKGVNLDSFAFTNDRKLRRGSIERKTKPAPSPSLSLPNKVCAEQSSRCSFVGDASLRSARLLEPDRGIYLETKSCKKTDRNSREYAPTSIKHRRGSFLPGWAVFGPLKSRKGEEKASVSNDAVRVKLPRFPSSDRLLLFSVAGSRHFAKVCEETNKERRPVRCFFPSLTCCAIFPCNVRSSALRQVRLSGIRGKSPALAVWWITSSRVAIHGGNEFQMTNSP